MNTKLFLRSIIAALAGGFGMWVVAGLWHNLIMPALYSETHATHEGIGIMLVAYIVLGALMAYMYPLGYKGGSPVLEGMRFGIIIGILWVFPHELAMTGAHGGRSIAYVIKNGLWHMVEQGIGGIIVGSIIGRRLQS